MTEPLWPFNVFKTISFTVSHIIIFRYELLAKVLSDRAAKDLIEPLWLFNVFKTVPFTVSQILIVLSSDALARVSLESKARELTESV